MIEKQNKAMKIDSVEVPGRIIRRKIVVVEFAVSANCCTAALDKLGGAAFNDFGDGLDLGIRLDSLVLSLRELKLQLINLLLQGIQFLQ